MACWDVNRKSGAVLCHQHEPEGHEYEPEIYCHDRDGYELERKASNTKHTNTSGES
jgi:hypothetical protein